MMKYRLKFYADTPQAKNQFFCWDIDPLCIELKLIEFMWEKNYSIRAAWFETVNTETGEIKNERITAEALQEAFEKGAETYIYKKK